MGVAPVPVVPSPKSHAYDVMLPSGELDPLASKVQVRLTQDPVAAAVAGRRVGFTLWLVVPLALESSVTVSVTLCGPEAL